MHERTRPIQPEGARAGSNLTARITAIAALSTLAGFSIAQSLEGTTFAYQISGVGLPTASGTATVGEGPEITLVDATLVQYDIDVDATGITITPAFFNPDQENRDWGVVNGVAVGSISLTWLDLPTPLRIAGATVSGDAGDDGDVFITRDSVRIGATDAAGGDNPLRWEPDGTMRIDLGIEAPCPWVLNENTGVYYASFEDALDTADQGDTLELGPCTFLEGGWVLRNLELTIRGQGMDATVLDAEGRSRFFDVSGDSRFLFEDLTLRGGSALSANGGGVALVRTGSDVTFRRVGMRETDSAGYFASVIYNARGNVVLDGCEVTGNTARPAGDGSHIFTHGGRTLVTNTLFEGNTNSHDVLFASDEDAAVSVVNCTFANNDTMLGIRAASDATAEIYNCVSDETLYFFETGANNLFPGAFGDDIDATPSFVDAENGDFRLASGTPGVDSGDYARYAAAGAGVSDLNGVFRVFDDPNAVNFDASQPAIDIGAFELQAAAEPAPDACLADLSNDGVLDLTDINLFTSEFLRGCD